jgi:hypothetical protein
LTKATRLFEALDGINLLRNSEALDPLSCHPGIYFQLLGFPFVGDLIENAIS